MVGLGRARELVANDHWPILDGEAGLVIVAPDERVLEQYRRRMELPVSGSWHDAVGEAWTFMPWSAAKGRPWRR